MPPFRGLQFCAVLSRLGCRSAFFFWGIELCRALTRLGFVDVLFGCVSRPVAIMCRVVLRPIVSSEAQLEIKRLRKQVVGLEEANEILRSVSVFFATERGRLSLR